MLSPLQGTDGGSVGLPDSLNGNTSASVYETLMDDHGLNEAVAAYMRQLIKERLTTKMLEIVDELQLLFSHHHQNAFPVRAGKKYDTALCADRTCTLCLSPGHHAL